MKSKRGSIEMKDLTMLAVVAVAAVAGLVMYNGHSRRKAEMERRAAEIARENRERTEKEYRERRLKDEEEFERKKHEARLAKEREEAEKEAADRERKRLAAEAEADRQRRLGEMKERRERYDEALKRFGAEFCLASEVPADDKPWSATAEKTFWCVFSSYPSERRIFEVKAAPGGVMGVVALSADGASETVDSNEFANRLKSEKSATASSSGRVFLTGVKPPVGQEFPIPPKETDFRIDEALLKEFLPACVVLKIRAPKTKFKIRLLSGSGKTNIDMGVIGYDDAVARSKMEKAIGEKLLAAAKRVIPRQSKVKKRKIRRTVKVYDGKYVKKGLDGVTLVPREFVFMGTSTYKMEDLRARDAFKKKWEALHAQAEREDEEERKIEEEYRAALEREKEAREEAHAQAESLSCDERAIEKVLSSCKLIVEQKGSQPLRGHRR